MRVVGTVSIDLSGLKNYAANIDAVRHRVYNQWIIRYRSFIQRRFATYSRGGGDWPPLKSRKGSILRDTSTLFATMAPTLSAPPGSINAMLPNGDGVEIGYAGNAAHPGGPTIPQIVHWHHFGEGNNPVRQIIVPPDNTIIRAMVADMDRALNGNSNSL